MNVLGYVGAALLAYAVSLIDLAVRVAVSAVVVIAIIKAA